LIKSHLLILAIGVASIATALAPANARGFGGMATRSGGVAVHASSAPALGRTHLSPAILRVPALRANKIGTIPSVGPRGITVRTKVGQLSSNVTYAISSPTKPSSPFTQIPDAIKSAGVTSSPTSGGVFGQAIQKLKDATAAQSTGGGAFGQAIQKLKDATAAANAARLADKLKLPAGTVGDKAQIPVPKGGGSEIHPPPTLPPHGPIGGGYGGGGYGGGGDVVYAPAVAPAGGSTVAVPGRQLVQQSPACGAMRTPPLAAALDELLPTAQLAAADLDAVKALRVAIADLAAAGKYMPARAVEEQAMSMLGYGKLWSRCGDGGFAWTKQVAAVQ
jgi:hypothetical protein